MKRLTSIRYYFKLSFALMIFGSFALSPLYAQPGGPGGDPSTTGGVGNAWSTSTLSVGRFNMAATSVNDKVLFGGGAGSLASPEDTVYSRVDIYNTTTSTWSTAALSAGREQLAATSLGSKAFFAGGRKNATSFAVVDVYDNSTGLWSTLSLSQPRMDLAAASAGQKVFFAGGFDYVNGYSDVVDIYDNSSGTWSIAHLSAARSNLVAVSFGTKVFFAGGRLDNLGTASSNIDIYDTQTDTWSQETLSLARFFIGATAVGSKVIFAGGRNWAVTPTEVNTIDIFDTSTSAWTHSTLSQGRSFLAAATSGDKAFFAGGYPPGTYSAAVDIYDNTTGQWSVGSLSDARITYGATASTGVIVFGGGFDLNHLANVVDIYTPGCPLLLISAPGTFLCQGDSVTMVASGSTQYTWSPSSGLSDTTLATVTSKPHATNNYSTFTYTVQGAPVPGCIPSASITITVDNPPPPLISPDTTICVGKSKLLSANGSYSYSWSPSAGLSDQTGAHVTANPTETTTYQVVGADYYGCHSSNSVTVAVDHPAVTTSQDTLICVGSGAHLIATGESGKNTYSWTPATGLSSTSDSLVTAKPEVTTTYTVTAENPNGCIASKDIVVNVDSVPKPVVDPIETTNSITLISSSAVSYQWFKNSSPINGATSLSYLASTNGTYNVQVGDGTCLSGMSDAYIVTGVGVVAGLSELPAAGTWIYPVPADEYVNFNWTGFDPTHDIALSFEDLTGKTQYQVRVRTTDTRLYLSFLSTGFYVVKGSQEGLSIQSKLIKR